MIKWNLPSLALTNNIRVQRYKIILHDDAIYAADNIISHSLIVPARDKQVCRLISVTIWKKTQRLYILILDF